MIDFVEVSNPSCEASGVVYYKIDPTYKNPPDVAEGYNIVKRTRNSNEVGVYSSGGREFSGYGASTIPIGHVDFAIVADCKRK